MTDALTSSLINDLLTFGATLYRDGAQLRCRSKRELSPSLRGRIRDQKAALLALPACESCDRWPLLTAESRAAGRCLRCMEAGDYLAAIGAMGARHRKEAAATLFAPATAPDSALDIGAKTEQGQRVRLAAA